MNRGLPPPLVALSPGDLAGRGADGRVIFLHAAREAIAAGLRGILVREPGMHDGPLLELAREVRRILGAGGWLAVHDRIHLAADCGAQAVHLGYRSLAPDVARSLLPGETALGFSGHAGDDTASWDACDYLFLGPVRDTPSKRGFKDPIGFERLAQELRRSSVPVWAIGGLEAANVADCARSGCAGLAVRSRLLAAPDPAQATLEFVREIDSSRFRGVPERSFHSGGGGPS